MLGGGGTGNVDTGDQGNYVIDEQDFVLNSAFALQTLTSIVITNTSTEGGTPIVLGVTAADISSTPLPATLPMFSAGLGLIGFFAKRKKRRRQAIAA